jgi:proprotein convertase subtilisin/kexin type 5
MACNRSSGCSGPLDSDCFVCASTAYSVVSGGTSTCASVCPAQYYATAQMTCLACNSLCSTTTPGCRGPLASQCNACSNFFDPTSRQCVSQCPQQTYGAANGTCLPCQSVCNGCQGPAVTQCVACLYNTYNGACVQSCPPKYYANSVRQCVACDSQCASACAGPAATDCLSSANQSACVNYLDGVTCVQSCNAQTQYADASRVCSACSPLCAGGCTGPSASQCVSCARGAFRLESSCVASCPSSYFANSSNVCIACSSQCADSCSGPGANQCIRCRYFNNNGVCVSKCDIGTYADNSFNCLACDLQCVACYGPSPSQCQAAVVNGSVCKNFISGSECVASCNAATQYAYQPTKTCLSCSSQCSGGCTGPLASQCNACAAVSLNGACVASCPPLYFADRSGVCTPCSPQCAGGCTGANITECTTCRNFQRASACVQQCDVNLEYADASKTCQSCQAQCSGGCTGACKCR